MTSNISKRISELAEIKPTGTNIRSIGREWLAICKDMFSDDSGYGYDKTGKSVFFPSQLKAEVSTGELSVMLRIADCLNRFEDTYGIPDDDNYVGSIISHLRKRADKDDIQAKVVLYFRVRDKGMAKDNDSTNQIKV